MIDFGNTAHDYAVYRRPFAPELYTRLQRFGIGIAGQRVLDLATGTGLLARPMAETGCRVIGVDVSTELLDQSRQLDSRDCPTHYAAARAERLPFANESFDAVVAGQCWHWFDRTVAPAEIRRVLVDHGKTAAVYQTHIPLAGSVAEATEQLILRYRPSWRHANSTGINGQVLRDLQSHGFGGIESFSFDITEPFTREQWRGLVRTWSAAGASLAAATLSEFDDELAKLLAGWPEPLLIPHRVFAAVATKRGGAYNGVGIIDRSMHMVAEATTPLFQKWSDSMAENAARIEQFRKMADADPNNEVGHFSLGRAYLDAGMNTEAVAAFQRVVELNPNLSKVYQLMATALLKLNQPQQAIEQLSRGVTIADERGEFMPRNEMTKMLKELGAPVPEFKSQPAAATAVGEGQVLCSRCGKVGRRLPSQPFSNAQGKMIFEHTCADCWREWIGMGTKVINELRLPLHDPQAQKIFDQHMMEFLNLK